MSQRKIGITLLWLVGITAIVALFFSQPIVQDETYHHFSDIKTIFGISNFWNVISNLPFLFVGILGLYKLYRFRSLTNSNIIFFIGVSLVAFGSGYYHLKPNTK